MNWLPHFKENEDMALREESMRIDRHNWYYEEQRGCCFVHEVKDKNGNYVQTDQFFVPWKKLLESVNRKYGKEITRA